MYLASSIMYLNLDNDHDAKSYVTMNGFITVISSGYKPCYVFLWGVVAQW